VSLLAYPGAYPEAHVDVTISSDDDTTHLPKPDASVDQKVSTGDDTGEQLLLSHLLMARLVPSCRNNPNISPLIESLLLFCLLAGVAESVHLLVLKWSKPISLADQVMTQVQLPPYHRPHSPLDLDAIEFIFGHIFEAFHQISQAVATSATSANDKKPLKRFC
jgi:hypothetical protein